MKINHIAVVTSDIVDSTALSKSQYISAIALLTELLQEAKHKFSANFEIYRGDGFQVVYPNPKYAMLSSLSIKLALKTTLPELSLNITQSLAVGDYQHLSHAAGQSSGDVFIASGRGLESTANGEISVHLQSPLSASDLTLSTLFLNHHLNTLSYKQATIGYLYLHKNFPEQHIIAEQLGVTRQNIAMHLKRGGFDLVRAYINTYQTLVETC